MTTETLSNDIEPNTASEPQVTAIPMRILRVATCPSLSGRSELTYHVGCTEAGAIYFRLWSNSAAGMFSNTWFSMMDVSKLLSSPEGITSRQLQPLWQYTSQNNAGFSLALLTGEGLIQKSADHKHAYQTANPAPFLERINALIASGVDLKEDDEPSEDLPIVAAATPKRGRHKKQSA